MGLRTRISRFFSKRQSTTQAPGTPPIKFGGEAGEDTAKFLRDVEEVAYRGEGKLDTIEAAKYAKNCLIGDALAWFNELDWRTQHDWILLEQAFLSQYPSHRDSSLTIPTTPASPPPQFPTSRSVHDLHSAPPKLTPNMRSYQNLRHRRTQSSLSIVPSPAVAPESQFPTPKSPGATPDAYPPSVTSKVCVVFDNWKEQLDRPKTYVSNDASRSGWFVTTTDPEEALLVKYHPDFPKNLKLINASPPSTYLGLHWDWDNGKLHLPSRHSANLVGITPRVTSTSPHWLQGPMESETWYVHPSGDVFACWEAEPGTSEPSRYLDVAMYNGEDDSRNCIYLMVDFNFFANAPGRDKSPGFVQAHLVLEPVSGST